MSHHDRLEWVVILQSVVILSLLFVVISQSWERYRKGAERRRLVRYIIVAEVGAALMFFLPLGLSMSGLVPRWVPGAGLAAYLLILLAVIPAARRNMMRLRNPPDA